MSQTVISRFFGGTSAAAKTDQPAAASDINSSSRKGQKRKEPTVAATTAIKSPASASKRSRNAAQVVAASASDREILCIDSDSDEEMPAAKLKTTTVEEEKQTPIETDEGEIIAEDEEDEEYVAEPKRGKGKATAASRSRAPRSAAAKSKPTAAASKAVAAPVSPSTSKAPISSTTNFLTSSSFVAPPSSKKISPSTTAPTQSSAASSSAAASSANVHPFFSSPSAAASSSSSTALSSPFRVRNPVKLSLPSEFPEDENRHEAFLNEFVSKQLDVAEREKAQEGVANTFKQLEDPLAASAAAAAAVAAASSSHSGGAVSFRLPTVFDLRKWSGIPATGPGTKFTPLEQQIVKLKSENPDVLLMVEVGYKYRFFGMDAQVASELLDIYCFPSKNLLTASVPTFRLYIHVSRLVEAGLKVGVVRQTESAASKKADKTSGPFSRGITETYTKATVIPSIDERQSSSAFGEDPSGTSNPSRFLMVLSEEGSTSLSSTKSIEDSSKVKCSMLALNTASGEVVYDTFDADILRQELLTRLQRIQPVEILVSADSARLSRFSEKTILQFANDAATSGEADGEGIRLEKLDKNKYKFELPVAQTIVKQFFDSRQEQNNNAKSNQKVPVVHVIDDEDAASPASSQGSATFSAHAALSLPKGVLICLSVLIPYLRSFGLESALSQSLNFHAFNAHSVHMNIDGLTLSNLEILKNQEGASKGSLMWLLNHTKTAFGARLLRKWVASPLNQLSSIQQRQEAVKEITQSTQEGSWSLAINQLLSHTPDLERGLARIQYRKCSPKEFLKLLQNFLHVSQVLPNRSQIDSQISTPFLRDLFAAIDVEQLSRTIHHFLDSINPTGIANNVPSEFFEHIQRDYPLIHAAKLKIEGVQFELQTMLKNIRKSLGPEYSQLEYLTVNNTTHQIELKVQDAKRAPKSWNQLSATKKAVRFHPPEVADAVDRLTLAREDLLEVSTAAWNAFLGQFNTHYSLWKQVIDLLAQVDCLSSLAVVAALPGYVCPEITETQTLQIQGMRHPMVEATSGTPDSFVANDVSMDEDGLRFYLITGANMGGKSTYIRSVAILVIMSQIGSFIPADSARMGVFDGVFTRMGARDSLLSGQSTFVVELSETNRLLRAATSKSLVILDELGRGTSTTDGIAIAAATSDYILEQIRCFTLFVTHYPLLGSLATSYPGVVRNTHMSYLEHTDGPKDATGNHVQRITFLYKLVDGLSPRSFGLNVARLAKVPPEVIVRAAQKAQEMRNKSEKEKTARLATARQEVVSRLKFFMRTSSSSVAPASPAADLRANLREILHVSAMSQAL